MSMQDESELKDVGPSFNLCVCNLPRPRYQNSKDPSVGTHHLEVTLGKMSGGLGRSCLLSDFPGLACAIVGRWTAHEWLRGGRRN